jgi:hypothetical protein
MIVCLRARFAPIHNGDEGKRTDGDRFLQIREPAHALGRRADVSLSVLEQLAAEVQ